ncbi:alpha/beta hydrolase [Falsarthrobacter nasiphocae]|uniref:Carboxylesterase n=1 Tax=Falsarthrobacter nasiphocae TaxID=189863 RepID=A0AAE4C4G8_9MICC|nr:alpha/beta fold hydrolase [Falsarthrobacter nasiphocae]MDR6891336.1 carboxylesterase [Falsarthrobacter nasiphocae]
MTHSPATGSPDPRATGPLAGFDETSEAAFRPYSFDAPGPREGRTGVLVIHGFTGSPTSVARWARTFADAGFSVRLPLLPGHGTTPDELRRSHRREWVEAAAAAHAELAETCDRVVVAGLSMGGTLALHLAETLDVAGVILVNPALVLREAAARLAPALRFVVPYTSGISNDIARPGADERAYSRTPVAAVAQLVALIRETRARLESVSAPVLLFVSETDAVLPPASAQAVRDGVRSDLVRVVRLPRSYHVATMDYDAPLIEAQSVAFVRSLA